MIAAPRWLICMLPKLLPLVSSGHLKSAYCTLPPFSWLESATVKVNIAAVSICTAAAWGLIKVGVSPCDVVSQQANKLGLIREPISAEYKQVSLFANQHGVTRCL